jgi:thiamine transporter ThiT
MGRGVRKTIRIVEVPIYLLAMAMGCWNSGSTTLAVVLLVTSIGRLWINHITDSSVYKDSNERKSE